jgi:predicted transposase YbfD/YdcC
MAARSAAAPALLPAGVLGAEHAPGLAAVGRIEACRTAADGRTAQTTRYLVLSRPLAPKKLLEVVRAHWSIENQLHSTLDVIFDEDEARSRKNYAPENLAVIRRLALNILNAHPDKRSTPIKMRRARWRQDFFLSLFAHLR